MTPKVTEFRGILRNSAEFDEFRNMEFRGIQGNSVYYTEYTEFKKTYGIPYKKNSENTLFKTHIDSWMYSVQV